jgi:molybdopterin/thiamine biosynthesis adenylyltransferase
MVAATWGAAEVAKSLFRSLAKDEAAVFPALEQTRHWDLWGHEFDRAPVGPRAGPGVDLGEVAVAGLGALGSAAVLALSHVSGLRGRIELVDDDRVSRSNLERVLTAGGRDVGRRKIDLARRALGCTGAQTACIASRYGAALPRGARAATIVLGVDSGAARRAITRHLPYAVYHGGTQGSEMLVSRHVAFAGACPECFYPEPPAAQRAEAPAARPDACARAVVVEALPEATIGFVSALCGFLMAAELVKDRLDPGRAAPLDDDRPVFRLDGLARTPGPECVEAYVPRRDCFCQSPEVRREIAARLGG